jgi:hypothetical protein
LIDLGLKQQQQAIGAPYPLLDLVVGRREITERHRDRDRLLGHVLKGNLELLARPQARSAAIGVEA